MTQRLLSLAVMLWAANSLVCTAAPSKPNFIVILADDLGYNDLGCYGSPLIKTPHLDRMAREGVRFTSFYVAASVCTPSRGALLTGCYPARIGLGDELVSQPEFGGITGKSWVKVLHSGSKLGLNPEETIIPEVLRPEGYFCGMIGKWHLGDAPEFNPVRQGFQFYFGTPYSNDMKPFYYISQTERLKERPVMDELTYTYTTHATNFIHQHKAEPFFLYLAHNMPHTPLTPGKRFAGRSPRGLYGDAVEEIDWSAGEIVSALKSAGVAERTLVIFLSDNGPWIMKGENGGSAFPLRNGKTTSYEGGFRVPCVMWGPGLLKNPGRVSDEIVTAMDFLPTFAAMAGIQHRPQKKIDGKNVSALITGEPGAKSPWSQFYYYFGTELHAVRAGEFKLRASNVLHNEDIYRRDAFTNAPVAAALHDLSQDLGEQKSIIKNRSDVVHRMEALLEEGRQILGDTLTGVKGTENRKPSFSENPVDPKSL